MSTTLLPFLYQTRTLQRLSRTGIATPALRAFLHSTATARSPRDRPRPLKTRHEDNNYIPFELPEGYVQEEPADAELDAESGVRSTITPSEKHVFNSIFEEIATRNKAAPSSDVGSSPLPDSLSSPPQSAAAPPRPDLDAANDFGVRTAEPRTDLVRNTFNFIIQDAAEARSNSRRSKKRGFDSPADAESEWDKALQRFPPSLRRAAQMALGAAQEENTLQFGEAGAQEHAAGEPHPGQQAAPAQGPSTESVLNEALRREERSRVEGKMRAAQTDFALWDVLEGEVFPMVRKLGLDENPARPGAAKRDKGKLPLDVYGPLYPSYLLTALRLLDTQFSRPSPLALHILPRVKELGPASYVLGVSTPFYNELARILWGRYGDPAAVFNLLEEMRVAGLYCDEGTRKVVLAIEQFLASVAQGQSGPFLRELASLPEYEVAVVPRVRHWMKTINGHIMERRNELPE